MDAKIQSNRSIELTHDEKRKEVNHLILLHQVIGEIEKTLRESLCMNQHEEPEDKKRLRRAFERLKRDHNSNSLASLLNVGSSAFELYTLSYGNEAAIKTAETIGKAVGMGVKSFQEYNAGNIQALDNSQIESSRKEADQRQENLKRVQNLEETTRRSINEMTARAIETYHIRG